MYEHSNDGKERWFRAGLYPGSCTLFEAKLVRELIARDGQFLDAELFLDWDEWDCTRRADRLGARVILSRDAPEDHDASSRTSGKSPMAAARQYYQSRNAIVVGRRYMPAWQFWLTLPLHLARDFSWFARLRLKGAEPNEKAYTLGAIDGLRGKMGRWKHHPQTPTASR
jgi:GT2 family glycosyltransferase